MVINFKLLKEYDNHKLVKRFEDKKTGLKGFVAIHNDNLGPAVGGTRMFPYVSEEEAIEDVLRLSKAMSYKCALAGVKYGGGKAVVLGDPKNKTPQLIKAYAREVDKLHGKFRTGEDVGISEDDVQLMLEVSPYFIGKRGFAGDPSPFASLSTFYSIETACELHLGAKSLEGISITVKGLGKVGSELVRLLVNEGAIVSAADINPEAIERVKSKFTNIKIIDPDKIHTFDVEVFAPCAMGNEITESTKSEIKAKIICGAANNQLANSGLGEWLHDNGILYIPDYVVNAGGLINVVDELEPGGYNRVRVDERIKNIKNTVANIINVSKKNNKSTTKIADQAAEEIFAKKHD